MKPKDSSGVPRHAPGPWTINLDPRYPGEPCIDAVINGELWHVALCHNAVGPEGACCVEANARLIAAAPELHSCLKEALPALRAELDRQVLARAQQPSIESVSLRMARIRYAAAMSLLEKIDRPLL